MYDERLRELLRGLPRESASAGFADAVIAASRRHPAHPVRWVAAAAIMLVAGLGVVAQRNAVYQERQQLIREQKAISAELAELKKLTRAEEPVVFVGGDENVDFVLDLRDEPPQSNVATVKLPASPRGSYK
jgi:hypothetical protein